MSDFFATARTSKVFVQVRALTEAGWISGMLLKASNRRVADTLNTGGDKLTLTNAFVPGGDADVPFMTVRRDKILLVMLDEREGKRPVSGVYAAVTERHVICLAGFATLVGTVDVPKNLRVSDYLGSERGFVEFRQVQLTVRNPYSGEQWTRKVDHLLLNSHQIVAVSEQEDDE